MGYYSAIKRNEFFSLLNFFTFFTQFPQPLSPLATVKVFPVSMSLSCIPDAPGGRCQQTSLGILSTLRLKARWLEGALYISSQDPAPKHSPF